MATPGPGETQGSPQASPSPAPAPAPQGDNNQWTVLLSGLPRIPEKDVDEWGHVTTAGILAGMVYGGARVARDSHSEYLSSFQELSTRFTQRELMEQRLLRIVRGSLRGGVQLGLMAGLFSAAQLTVAALVCGGQQDRFSTAGAGAFTGAVMGLVEQGTAVRRLQASAGFAVLGGAIAFPLGMVQDQLRAMLPEPPAPEEPASVPRPEEEVAAAIHRLENRLREAEEEAQQAVRGARGEHRGK